MKRHFFGWPTCPARWRAGCLLLAIFGTFLLSGAMSIGYEPPLQVDVRTSMDRPFEGLLGKAKAKDHGKVYLIASLTNSAANGNGAESLVKPVNESALLTELRHSLAERGYREITSAETPEIVLTVVYGRGFLRNPYLSDSVYNETSDPPTATIIGGIPLQMIREKEFGFEQKLQRANFEKLFIRITAWEYPKPPSKDQPKAKKRKPHELWKTDMIIDDPNHRDLNRHIKEMLAAGSQYFDREIEKEEVTITTEIREGRVILGPLQVTGDDADKPTKK